MEEIKEVSCFRSRHLCHGVPYHECGIRTASSADGGASTGQARRPGNPQGIAPPSALKMIHRDIENEYTHQYHIAGTVAGLCLCSGRWARGQHIWNRSAGLGQHKMY